MSKLKPPRAVIEQPEIIISDNAPLEIESVPETIKNAVKAAAAHGATEKREQYNTMLKPSTVERLKITAAKQKKRTADIIESVLIKYFDEL